MDQYKTPKSELEHRLKGIRSRMNQAHPEWELLLVVSKVNQFYYTGTMQDGLLLIPREGQAMYWVRQSYERAVAESNFDGLRSMRSYRDIELPMPEVPKEVYLESDVVPLSLFSRIQKYLPFDRFRSADLQLSMQRAVKSEYELQFMRRSGEIHHRVLTEMVPSMLRVGMTEADLALELYHTLVAEGHHGLARFAMFQTEILLGHVCFGESSIFPTYFNGPGGNYGMSPAVPLFGSREHKLKEGDAVFIDVACGFEGYHTDKTETYLFKGSVSQEVQRDHDACVAIQNNLAAALKPGAIPSQLFEETMGGLSPEFLQNFMGYGERQVKFLGHGVGLFVDELPVIAKGFDCPVEENMTFALEPKKGITNVGMVGIENTFVVKPEGAEILTGVSKGLIEVG